ncbi:MAG: hypothetical protein FWB80_12820 [Defluviitaleaceae bacterium]|nr:hypothetical protein [Defluviitaleaceae bacterium]
MIKALYAFTENFAKEIAQTGHNIRTEDLSEIEKISGFMQSANHIIDELNKIGQENLPGRTTNLVKINSDMMEMYDKGDAVGLADVMEYELLNELEEVLYKLENAG